MRDLNRRQFLKMLAGGAAGLAASGVWDALGAGRALAGDISGNPASGAGLDPFGQSPAVTDDLPPLLTPPDSPLELPPWKYGRNSRATDTVLMFRGSPARNFYGTGPLRENPRHKWEIRLDRFPTLLRGVPVVWSGTGWTGQPVRIGKWVFVGGVDRYLYAIRAATGQVAWKLRLPRMIKGSVCVYENRIFVPNVDNFLRCVDAATGEILWAFDTGNDLDSSPCVWEGGLYIAGECGYARCLDPADGREIWKAYLGGTAPGTLSGSNGSETSPAVYDGLYYAATYDGWLHCLDARSGRRVWRARTGDDTDASPVISGRYVLTAAEQMSPYVMCFDRLTGKPVWRYGGRRGGYWATPACAEGRVYIGCGAGGGMVCLDEATGREVWTTKIPGPIWSSACVVDGKVVFGCHDGNLYMLDAADGRIVWSYKMDGRCLSTPCIVDGDIHVGTATGTFHCFG